MSWPNGRTDGTHQFGWLSSCVFFESGYHPVVSSTRDPTRGHYPNRVSSCDPHMVIPHREMEHIIPLGGLVVVGNISYLLIMKKSARRKILIVGCQPSAVHTIASQMQDGMMSTKWL